MTIEVVGDTAYEMVRGSRPPLTDTQAEVLAAEYSKLGIEYKKETWEGENCVITKAPAADFKRAKENLSDCWEQIRESVGYEYIFVASNNSFDPGNTSWSPESDWERIVAFIDSNF